MSVKTTTYKVSKQNLDYQLSDEQRVVIGSDVEYQHTYKETEAKPSALYPILVELNTYLTGLVDTVSQDEVTLNVNQYADKITNQLQLDNTTELRYIDKNVEVIDKILNYTLFDLTTLTPDAINLIKAIRAIFIQYNGLLDYVPKYTEAYSYKPTNDDPSHIEYYKAFVDYAVQNYVYKLLEATGAIDAVVSQLSRKGLYRFLVSADIELIEPNTQIENFVAVSQAVQNNRIYRGRELMIIAVGEAVAVCNLIRLMWLLIQLNYEALELENKDNSNLYEEIIKAIEEFEKSRDPELLDKLQDLIKKLEEELKRNEALKNSQISQNLTQISKLKDKCKIQRYIDTLDGFIAKVRAINNQLANIRYDLDYSGLQAVLDKLLVLQGLIDKILGDQTLAKYFEKANQIIKAINRTIEAIKEVNCLIKQAMCLIASSLNFTNSVLAPAIKDMKDTANRLLEDTESLIEKFARETLEPFNNVLKRVIYEQARTILKGRCMELSTELNKDEAFVTQYNSVVDAVIDSALGNGTSAMEYLKNVSNKAINDIADNLTIDERNSVNCPPLKIKGNLSVPNLSMQSNMPSLNDIKLGVDC